MTTAALRLVTYNLCEGGAERVDAIAAMLRRQRADAIGLTEASNRANLDVLGRQLHMQVMYGEANSWASVAWLTRLPIRSSTNHRLQELAKTVLEVEVMWADAPLHLFVTHLADRCQEVTHPRDAEVQTIVGLLPSIGARRHLLVGDFNAVAPGDPVGEPPTGVDKTGDSLPDASRRTLQHLLEAGYVDCYRVRHPRQPGFHVSSRHSPATPGLRLRSASHGQTPGLLRGRAERCGPARLGPPPTRRWLRRQL